MARPHGCRRVEFAPKCQRFRPQGVNPAALEEVFLGLDELESLRLAELEGLYQEEAAARMDVSRPTFSRIIESARRKVADAMVNGKALRLEGGGAGDLSPGWFYCADCKHTWRPAEDAENRNSCPRCRHRHGGRGRGDHG